LTGQLRESEEIAARALESMGFKIIERRSKVIVDNVEVSDVDIVAERDGVRYAVEVKAGYVDVSSVRQAYVNSVLTGMKPLLVARGFSDEAAVAVARRLYVNPDELYETIEAAVEEALDRVTRPLSMCGRLSKEQVRVLSAIASSDDFMAAAKALGLSPDELGHVMEALRSQGVVPRGDFRAVRVSARLLLLCESLARQP